MVMLLAMTPFSQRRYLVPLIIGLAVGTIFNLGLLASTPHANDPGAAQILTWLQLPFIRIVANVGSGLLILWGAFGILFGGSQTDRLVRSLRQRGDYEGAGEIYLQHGKLQNALANFKKGKSWIKAASVANRLKRYAEAGGVLPPRGRSKPERCGRAYRQANDPQSALKCDRDLAEWLAQNEFLAEAVGAWIRAGEPKQALRIANVALKQGQLQPSDGAFRPVLRVAKQMGDHATEARLNEVLGEWPAVGYAWRAAGEHGKAASAFLKADKSGRGRTLGQ